MQIGKERTNMWCAQLNSFGLSDVENFEMKKKTARIRYLYKRFSFYIATDFKWKLCFGQDRILKPLGGYVGYNSEWRELAQTISRVS